MKPALLILTVLTIFTGCGKEIFPTKDNGVIRAPGGSCDFIIEIEADENENRFLEPSNINDFDLELAAGMNVEFKYRISENGASICQMEYRIDLTKLKEK
jgi:hypothetical protein